MTTLYVLQKHKVFCENIKYFAKTLSLLPYTLCIALKIQNNLYLSTQYQYLHCSILKTINPRTQLYYHHKSNDPPCLKSCRHLLLCAPTAASVFATVACPHYCHCWLKTSLATVAIVAMVAAEMVAVLTVAGEIFLWGDVQNITY